MPDPSTKAPTPAPTLNYAPRPRLTRRTKRLIWILALILMTTAAWYTTKPYRLQARIVWNQRKLTRFQAPPGTVAFTSDEQEAARLLAGNSHVRVEVGYVGSGMGPYVERLAGYAPVEADELFDPQSLQRGKKVGNDPLGPPPTLFLGLRQSANGQRRLVYVTMFLWRGFVTENLDQFVRGPEWTAWVNDPKNAWRRPKALPLWELRLRSCMYAPATLRPGSTLVAVRRTPKPNQFWQHIGYDVFAVPLRMGESPYISGPIPVQTTLRIPYGHPDPADESKIILPYEYDGEKGRLIGTLTLTRTQDTEAIDWQVEGPLKPWPKE